MEVVDFLLDGLEAALELERELGVRSLACDRGVLGATAIPRLPSRVSRPAGEAAVLKARDERPATGDLVFLHDRPLTPAGVEMMAKILNALGKPDAPIVVAPPVPKAQIVVVLGGRALKRYFPDLKGEPGQWVSLPDGREVLITYSPEYILRFGAVTPAVQKLKQDMWRSLKSVLQRCVAKGPNMI